MRARGKRKHCPSQLSRVMFYSEPDPGAHESPVHLRLNKKKRSSKNASCIPLSYFICIKDSSVAGFFFTSLLHEYVLLFD